MDVFGSATRGLCTTRASPARVTRGDSDRSTTSTVTSHRLQLSVGGLPVTQEAAMLVRARLAVDWAL